jgi:hypothetical protein
MLQLNTHLYRLKQLRSFAKKNWLLLTLVTLVLLGLVGFILRYTATRLQQSPPSLIDRGNSNQTRTNFFNLTFTGSAPAVPEKMWIAQVTQFSESNDSPLIDSLIKKFQLQPSPHVTNVWKGETYSLEFDQTNNEYRLSKNFLPRITNSKTISQSSVARLITSASQAAKDIFPDTLFIAFPEKIELLRADGLFEEAPIETATHIRIPFGLSYYDTPVLLDFSRGFPMTIVLDADGEMTALVARPFTAEFEASSQHSTLSTQEAIQEIQRGNASIVDSYSEQTITPKLESVVRGEFISAALEYRIDTSTNLLIPYYHFKGTLVNIDNDIFTADVITPAVRLNQ